jgi:uncharacterized protein with von Willebrand factor type A (vWA) domain
MKQSTFQHTFTDEYLSDMRAMGLIEAMLDTLADAFKEMTKKALIDGAGQETEIINQKRVVFKIEDGNITFNIE